MIIKTERRGATARNTCKQKRRVGKKMNTNADKSMLYFIDNLLFCMREMFSFNDAENLVLKVTPEAKKRIEEWLHSEISTLDKEFHPKYLYGVEIEVVDNVDSDLGFEVCKRGN